MSGILGQLNNSENHEYLIDVYGVGCGICWRTGMLLGCSYKATYEGGTVPGSFVQGMLPWKI